MCDCAKPLVLDIEGKTSDMCFYRVSALDIEGEGYVPSGLGVGGGDYLRVKVCLACGKLQNFKPLTEENIRAAFEE